MASSSSAQVYDDDQYEVHDEDDDEEEEEDDDEEEGVQADGYAQARPSIDGEAENVPDEDEDEEDWTILSTSPSPHPHSRTQMTSVHRDLSQNHTHTQRPFSSAPVSAIQGSPQCSMDDDSSTDESEEDEVLPPPPPPPSSSSRRKRKRQRRESRHSSSNNSSPPPFSLSEHQQFEIPSATSTQQRNVQIKNLELKLKKECLAHCRKLIALQRQWHHELESQVPGLINHNYVQQQELYKQRGGPRSQSDLQMQTSVMVAARARASSNYKHSTVPGHGRSSGDPWVH